MSSFACLKVSDIIFCLFGVVRHHLLPAWDILMPSFAHSEYSDVISEECTWSHIVTIVVIHIRPILHAMGQDDMITYIQVHTLPVDIRFHDMV